jgi:hypothetical protein
MNMDNKPGNEESCEILMLKAFFTGCLWSSLSDENEEMRIGAILCLGRYGGRDVMLLLQSASGRLQDCEAAKNVALEAIAVARGTSEATMTEDEIRRRAVEFLRTLIVGPHGETSASRAARSFLEKETHEQSFPAGQEA